MVNEAVSFKPKHRSVTRNTQFRLRRVNSYCEGMQYHGDVGADGELRVNLGPLKAAVANHIVESVALSAGSGHDAVIANAEVDAPYGRVLQIVASGANTRTATITGWDCLGQPMTEEITFNGTTPVDGKKAFFFVESVSIASGADTTTITVGTANKLGLPYYTVELVREMIDGEPFNDGSVTKGLQGTQTATTADPRGVYVPVQTMDGSKEFVVTIIVAAMVTDGVGKFAHPVLKGGLHGERHYAG